MTTKVLYSLSGPSGIIWPVSKEEFYTQAKKTEHLSDEIYTNVWISNDIFYIGLILNVY